MYSVCGESTADSLKKVNLTATKKFLYNQDDLIFPEQHLYNDYLCKVFRNNLNVTNWTLPKNFFDVVAEKGAYTRSLKMNYAIGVTLLRLDSIRKLQMVNVVHLRGAIVIDLEVARILSGWTRIYELDISDCTIGPKALSTLLSRLSILKTLYCEKCQGIDDFSMQAIANCVQKHRKLTRLYISQNSDFSDEGVLAVLTAGSSLLKWVDLSGSTSITSLSMAGLRKRMGALSTLNISNIRNLGQSVYEWISEGCLFVTELNLHKSAALDDPGLISIGRRMRYLQTLILSNCFNISDVGVAGFCSNFEGSLTSLDISGCVKCGGPAALAISGICQQFKCLRVNCLSQVPAEGMQAIWTQLPEIEVFEMCADLRSSGTHRRSMIPHISDATVVNGKMSSLRVVHLTGACQITDRGACWIAAHCANLEDVDVSFCNSITDALPIALGCHNRRLKYAILSGLGHISDRGIVALCQGCPRLVRLDCIGCHRLTDVAVKAISSLKRLQALNLSSCDDVTDDGILALAANLVTLKYVDISNLSEVSKVSIGKLARTNLSLIRLNAQSCNIVPADYSKACKKLPFTAPARAKCVLEPRHRSVVSYNTFVNRRNTDSRNIVCIQALVRGWVQWRKHGALLRLRKQSALNIQRVWRGSKSREASSAMAYAAKMLTINARKLQKQMRRLMAIRLARRKRRAMKERLCATKMLQRCTRGYLTRKRLFHRFKKRTVIRSRLFYLSQKMFILRAARETHRKIVMVQSVGKRIACQAFYARMKLGFEKLQVIVKVHIAVHHVLHRWGDEETDTQLLREYAAIIIGRSWRAKIWNGMVVNFTLTCAIHRRNELDMVEWVAQTEHNAAVRIQALQRGGRCRYKLFLKERAAREGWNSAIIAQKYIRRFIARCKFLRWRPYMKRVSALWRRMYKSAIAYFYAEQAKIIQRTFKKLIFLRKRERAAAFINRVYRGHRGRNVMRAIIFTIHTKCAIMIQRTYREYRRRQYEHFIRARNFIAARRIQVAARKRIAHVAMQRVTAAKRAKELEKELKRKEALLNEKRLKVINRIKDKTRHGKAAQIQRVWRHYKREKDKRLTAAKAREDMMKDLVDEKNKKKDLFISSLLPNPVQLAKDAATAMQRFLKEIEGVDDTEKPRYTLSVLKFQTQSIVQMGIIDIHMTFGEGETHAFEQRQIFNKSTRKRYFEMLEGDLSGHLHLEIYLWIMRGKGTECICNIKVKNKPAKSSNAANRSRVSRQRIDGINIAWHEQVHIEIHGICSLKRAESGFAVDGIRICHTMEEAQDAKTAGYHLNQDMQEFNLPTSLWVHGKEKPPNETVFDLSRIEGEDWFDERLRKTCQKFNLLVEDVYQMRSTFDAILRGSYDFTTPVQKIWEYMHITPGVICAWLIDAAAPRLLTEITFSEYVYLISFFSVFGRMEKIRFIFGHTCTTSNQTMNEAQFRETVNILTETFTGQKNTTSWHRAFHAYCNPKLKLMFISNFEQFVKENYRIMWALDEIQLKFMTNNVGRNYWDSKVAKYREVRNRLGLKIT